MSGLREHLQEVYDQQGSLTPALVVAAATPEASPLHHRFEWDDKAAGHQYRLVQARELIRSVTVVYRETAEGEEVRTRAFVTTYQADQADSGGYVPTEQAMADPLIAALVLRAFERDLAALRRSYSHLSEYRDLIQRQLLGDQVA